MAHVGQAELVFAQSTKTAEQKTPAPIGPAKPQEKAIVIEFDYGNGKQSVSIPHDRLLFNLDLQFDESQPSKGKQKIVGASISPKPELEPTYKKLEPKKSQKVVFIYPIFTQAAYSKGGFYDYYAKKCDTKCLTVKIPAEFSGGASSSVGAASVLYSLNYPFVTDIDVDKNPSILKKYDKVIVLHNEYVTKKEFDAITKHKNVVYLYPNAMYAMVKPDYKANTITLVKGHGYPDEKIGNGFGWKHDNSKYEYDLQCDNWKFTSIPNGKMLNCNPDYRVFYDKDLLLKIRS